MKYAFLLGALLAWATPGMAQCGCTELALAMDDNRQYHYSYRIANGGDTTAAILLGSATNTLSRRKRAADRPHVDVPLSSYQATSILLCVTDVATNQKMQLTFDPDGSDATYHLLFDFAPGSHYQLTLADLRRGPVAGAEGFEVLPKEKSRDGRYWLKLRKK